MTNSTYVMFVEAKNTLSISPCYWWSCILSPHQYQDHDSFPDDFTQHYCQNSSSYWSQKEVLFDWLVVLVSLHSLSDVLPIAIVRVDHNELLGSHVAQVRAVTRSLYLHDSPYWLSSKLYQPFCQILSLALMLMIFLVLADYKNPFMTDFWKGENALHKNNIIKT